MANHRLRAPSPTDGTAHDRGCEPTPIPDRDVVVRETGAPRQPTVSHAPLPAFPSGEQKSRLTERQVTAVPELLLERDFWTFTVSEPPQMSTTAGSCSTKPSVTRLLRRTVQPVPPKERTHVNNPARGRSAPVQAVRRHWSLRCSDAHWTVGVSEGQGCLQQATGSTCH